MMNKNVKQHLDELKATSTWFWSKEFIKPHVNPLLAELEKTYSVILETFEKIESNNLVNVLMSLEIKKSLLLKHIMIFLDISAETLDRTGMYIKEKAITGLTLHNRFVPFEKLGRDFSKNLNNEAIYSADSTLARDLLNILAMPHNRLSFHNLKVFRSVI